MKRQIKGLQIDEVYIVNGALLLQWSANIGFGQLEIYNTYDDDGTGVVKKVYKVDSECMSQGEDKEFVRMVMNAWIDQMEVVE